MPNTQEKTIAEKIELLKDLQDSYSRIDSLQLLLEDLPVEIQDIEDEVAKTEYRISELELNAKELTKQNAKEKVAIEDAEKLISRYSDQLQGIKNNREHDSLTKEIEFQKLNIEHSQKKISENKEAANDAKTKASNLKEILAERKEILAQRKASMGEREEAAQKEIASVEQKIESIKADLDQRLVRSFMRVRGGNKNGLALVRIDRDACGGCFNRIPAQDQMDVKLDRKLLTCEYCGRIIVRADDEELD